MKGAASPEYDVKFVLTPLERFSGLRRGAEEAACRLEGRGLKVGDLAIQDGRGSQFGLSASRFSAKPPTACTVEVASRGEPSPRSMAMVVEQPLVCLL